MVLELIKEVELLAIRSGEYYIYVFQVENTGEYVMCTRLPNWQVPDVNIGDKGFLKYQTVKAGDEYVTPEGTTIVYKYTNTDFINFVNRSSIFKNKEIIL